MFHDNNSVRIALCQILASVVYILHAGINDLTIFNYLRNFCESFFSRSLTVEMHMAGMVPKVHVLYVAVFK